MPYTGSSSGGHPSGTATASASAKGPRRASGTGGSTKATSRSYPRGVGPDFRKLTGLTLLSYIDHHGVSIREDAPPSELAVAVARHFESLQVPEEEAIYGFLERLDEKGATATTTLTAATTGATRAARKTLETDYGRQSASFLTTLRPPAQRKRRRTKASARPSEQVAAKVTRTDENGSWILASVQRFYPETETYDVQDEDDTTKLIRLPWSHVMRLSTGTEGVFSKNNECMAIFPETTSFYRALVSKAPVWVWDTARRQPVVQELVVKFEDDEDAAGRTPHRRVPARYVIPIPTEYFCDEADDVDLTPPK